jgi:hypothetical protein
MNDQNIKYNISFTFSFTVLILSHILLPALRNIFTSMFKLFSHEIVVSFYNSSVSF